MNSYVVLKKGATKVAVDIVIETAGEEIRGLQSDGFEIVADNIQAENSQEALAKTEEMNGVTNSEVDYQSKYKTAQFVSMLISFFGWLTFAVGILLTITGLGSSSGRYGFDIWQAIALVTPGFTTLVSGLFLVATSQVMRATVDNADHSFQILVKINQQKN
ncbi:hypothetical protein AB9R81_23010 [Vibrio cyclitrophicus]|uniref:hypothetical protein n=1 Tax=Vibrio cyclitrophicus TaxID=47951 RepID=UPI00148BC822|nr:hypothetical protein [Vibrio cyclitrophicus]NOI36088.1 hypothetical protein [Vibrio cyclitrophicus]